MSFLGGFLTPPPSKQTNEVVATSGSAPQGRRASTAEKSKTSLYNALTGVKSIVSSYSATKSAPHPRRSQHEKELEGTMHRFRLQSPENHLGMLMAFSDKSLSPFLSEEFCFTWHRYRLHPAPDAATGRTTEGGLEDLVAYNLISQNAHSWYPPTADDLNSVIVLHCEDTLGYGLSRQLESTPMRATEAFQQRVETAIRQNKVMERVVISSCNHHVPHSRHRPSVDRGTTTLSLSRATSRVESSGATHAEGQEEEYSSSDGDDDSQSDSSSESGGENPSFHSNVALPDFEVGGSIAVNAEGIFLRERGTEESGLHIDCTNYLSLTCLHPASFILEVPLYHASRTPTTPSTVAHTDLDGGADVDIDTDTQFELSDTLAPLSSIRDLSDITTLRPSVEWLGDLEGEMFSSLESILHADPHESSLAVGLEGEQQQQELLFSSLCLQVACRDRATRDVLVLAIRSMAGYVPPLAPSTTGETPNHSEGLSQRLALLPWHRFPSQAHHTTTSNTPADTDTTASTCATAGSLDMSGVVPPSDDTPEMSANVKKNAQLKRIQELESLVQEMSAHANAKELEASEQLQHLQQQLRQLQQQQAEREVGDEQRDTTVASLHAQLAEQLATRAILEKRNDTLSSDLHASSAQVESLQREVASLEEDKRSILSASETSHSIQANQIEELAGLVKELEGARQETFTALQGVQEEKSALLKSLEQQRERATQREHQEREREAQREQQEREREREREEESSNSADIAKELEKTRLQCSAQLSRLRDAEAEAEQLRQQLSLSMSGEDNPARSSSSGSSKSNNSDGTNGHHTSPDADADADTDSDSGIASSTTTSSSTTTASVRTVYPMAELRGLIDHFHIPGQVATSIVDGDGVDDFAALVEAVRVYVTGLAAQLADSNKKLVLSDAALMQAQEQHQVFLKTLEDKVQFISEEMTEKTEAHRQQSLASLATIDGLNESVHVLQNKIQKSEESKRAEEDRVASLKQEVETLQGACADLRKKALHAQEGAEETHRSELDKLTGECSKWQEECVRLKEMMMSMQKAAKQKEEAATKLKSDFDILTVRLQEEKQHNELLREQAAKDSRSFKEQSDQFKYEKSQAANTVKVLEARISGLQSETLTLSDERQVLKRQKSAFDSSRNQIAQLRGQLVESDQSAQATRALLDETAAQNERLKKELTDMSVELGNVNSLLAQKTSRIDELKDRLQVMDNEITSADKVKSSFRKENARLKEAAKKLKEDSDTVKKLKPLYNQQLSKIADGQSRIVDLESSLSDTLTVRNQYALTVSALELRTGALEKAFHRRSLHSEREGMAGEDHLTTSTALLEKTRQYQANISRLESELSEAKMAEPFELKRLNFMVCKLGGEKNHYEKKAKSLSKDLQRKLLAGTPLQRELGKVTARLEEVENERNAYRDAMVLACETYSTKEVSSWFG